MGAEAIMDLSSFGDTKFRRKLTSECPAIIREQFLSMMLLYIITKH